MASRPSTPAQVIKGKFISATEGFADTFNWLAQTLFNLKGGNGIKIFWADDTHPTIEADGKGTVEVVGTDDSKTTKSPLKFKSANDSNVVVTCNDENDNGAITIGVYYI